VARFQFSLSNLWFSVSVVNKLQQKLTTETTECIEISQRGLGRNQILAPEEPNVYSTAITAGPALQRSAMFQTMTAQIEQVSLLWSEENAFGVARSINISSLRDEESAYKISLRKQEVGPLYYRLRRNLAISICLDVYRFSFCVICG